MVQFLNARVWCDAAVTIQETKILREHHFCLVLDKSNLENFSLIKGLFKGLWTPNVIESQMSFFSPVVSLFH